MATEENNERPYDWAIDSTPRCEFEHGSVVVEVCSGVPIGTIPWEKELPGGAILITYVYVCADHWDMIGGTWRDIDALDRIS